MVERRLATVYSTDMDVVDKHSYCYTYTIIVMMDIVIILNKIIMLNLHF